MFIMRMITAEQDEVILVISLDLFKLYIQA